MASPRIRRLQLDAESIRSRFQGWPLIELSGQAGLPPELYRFTYRVRGLYVDPAGNILEREMHVMEVNLSLGYPRRAPQCRMLTPVFHPNFDDASVCIGDFWAASEGLDDLVVRIGRMIAYQEYNVKSPLNGIAAKWAAQNTHLLPIDPRPIAPPMDGGAPFEPVAGFPDAAETPAPAAADPQAASEAEADPWSERIVISTTGN
ncbi:MAG: ubiquitin-conjugating enzyme E2 [Acidobacteriota bacterium]